MDEDEYVYEEYEEFRQVINAARVEILLAFEPFVEWLDETVKEIAGIFEQYGIGNDD